MVLQVSPCLNLKTPEYDSAISFYRHVLEMELREVAGGVEAISDCLTLAISRSETPSVSLEGLTRDLITFEEKAKFYGFDLIEWKGRGSNNRVRDPFGFEMTVYEESSDAILRPPIGEGGLIQPYIAFRTPQADDAAEFYAALLGTSLHVLKDDSVVVPAAEISLRFKPSEQVQLGAFLSTRAPVEELLDAGARLIDNDTALADPFGLCWFIDMGVIASHAVIESD